MAESCQSEIRQQSTFRQKAGLTFAPRLNPILVDARVAKLFDVKKYLAASIDRDEIVSALWN